MLLVQSAGTIFLMGTFVVDYLTRTDRYGFPDGAARRIQARRLACIHITANSPPVATAKEERDNVNRATNTVERSAHVYVDRRGGGIIAIDWRKYAAWGNGGVSNPKTSVPGIPETIALRTQGFNVNEDYWLEIENCGWNPDFPITESQLKDVALLIAEESLHQDIPIDRSTVHLHSDLDSVNRDNCPVPATTAETWVNALISRANTTKQEILTMTLEEKIAEIQRLLTEVSAEAAALQTQVTTLQSQLSAAQTALAAEKTRADSEAARVAAMKQKTATFAADIAND